MQRALYLARHHGIEAVGFNAVDVAGADAFATRIREIPAWGRMLLDVHVLGTKPRHLGPRIPIGED